MKVLIERPSPGSEEAVEIAMLRYRAAHKEYQGVVDENRDLTLRGGEPSPLARLDEERAFEELDCARHALFEAASVAFPTIH